MIMINFDEVIIDVSQAQGSVDLVAIADSLFPRKLIGVIGRITRGANVVDDVGIAAIIEGMSMGLPYNMAYHFATSESAALQSINITTTIDLHLSNLFDDGCLWIDIENDSVTGLPYNKVVGRDILSDQSRLHPEQVGWYSGRWIARQLVTFDPIFAATPSWVAIVDGDIQSQADDYRCALVQWDQADVNGTTAERKVDLNSIAIPEQINSLCKVSTPTPKKAHDMILFAVPSDVFLWNGSSLVGLGGLVTVYNKLVASGVVVLDTVNDPIAKAFYDRMVASAPKVSGSGSLTGTITFG